MKMKTAQVEKCFEMLEEAKQRRLILIAAILFLIFVAIPQFLTDDTKLEIVSAAYQHEWYFLYLMVVVEIAAFLAFVLFAVLLLRLLWHAGSWFSRGQPRVQSIGDDSQGRVPIAPAHANEGVYDASLESEADQAIGEMSAPNFDGL